MRSAGGSAACLPGPAALSPVSLAASLEIRVASARPQCSAWLIDAARVPVYLAVDRAALAALWPIIAIAAAGVFAGTLYGERLLARVPEAGFRAVVGTLLVLLGLSFLLPISATE